MLSTTTWDDLEGENALVVMGVIARLLRMLERQAGDLDAKDWKDAFCGSCNKVGPMLADDYKCLDCRNGGNSAYLRDLEERYIKDAKSGDYQHLMDVSHEYAYEFLRTTLHVPEFRPTPEDDTDWDD